MSDDKHQMTTEYVRNSLLIKHFHDILALCHASSIFILPLKGISLMFSLYQDNLYRNMADLDLFIDKNQTEEFIETIKTMGYKPRSEKKFKPFLKSKGKFDLIASTPYLCDLDIHTELITKKFFRMTTPDFTSFALSRLSKKSHRGSEIHFLSPVDEWVFLAQHYCFHYFSGKKWLHDLYLLQLNFSPKEVTELLSVAEKFHFNRVVTAVHRYLTYYYPADHINIPAIVTKRHMLFDRIFNQMEVELNRSMGNRIIAAYWEFLFMDQTQARIKAYFKLLFPDYSLLSCIYSQPANHLLLLLYPVHFIIVILSSVLWLPLMFRKFVVSSRPH